MPVLAVFAAKEKVVAGVDNGTPVFAVKLKGGSVAVFTGAIAFVEKLKGNGATAAVLVTWEDDEVDDVVKPPNWNGGFDDAAPLCT